MAHTDALGDLLQQLHTDTDLQEKFKTDPAEAIEPFDLTHHEEDALVTRDLDDFVAVGAVHAISELPEVLRGDQRDPEPDLPDHLRLRLERIEANILHLFERHPAFPRVPPQPGPGPFPQPGPGPESSSGG